MTVQYDNIGFATLRRNGVQAEKRLDALVHDDPDGQELIRTMIELMVRRILSPLHQPGSDVEKTTSTLGD